MRHERIKITRDTNTVHNKTVCPWEIPVIEFLFEDANVTRLGEYVEVKEEYPAPLAEFQRLTLTYGEDRKSGVPHVASVYGDARRGVKALGEAIEEARKADIQAAKTGLKTAKAPKQRSSRKVETADALLS